MRIHKVSYGSRANGPGVRNVLHVQGCSLACVGCFNKNTWDAGGGTEIQAPRVVELLLRDLADGITITGGEPVEQWEELREVLIGVREQRPSASIVVFTGYSRTELEQCARWEWLTRHVDMLVTGRWEHTKALPATQRVNLRASSNQEVWVSGGRITARDLLEHDVEVEVGINEDGSVVVRGLPSYSLLRLVTYAAK